PHTIDLLRQRKPNLSAWTTSFSWGDMGVEFVRMIHENMYAAKVNAIIPWAGIQHPPSWIGGDPNPGNAIKVNDDGTYEIRKGYYFYKQLTRAGKRGMKVAYTSLANPQAFLIAFSGEGTEHPDAFVLSSNIFIWGLPIEIKLKGTKYTSFRAYRSSEDGQEKYTYIGEFEVKEGSIIYDPPRGSTTSFIGVE
ncbi:MAG: hypothetical protein AAFR66_19685, partial [Bacteroidota bacterium]